MPNIPYEEKAAELWAIVQEADYVYSQEERIEKFLRSFADEIREEDAVAIESNLAILSMSDTTFAAHYAKRIRSLKSQPEKQA